MWRGEENVEAMMLICFFTKKGGTTVSPYEAQIWKKQSIPVYARMKNLQGTIEEALVKKIDFHYKRNAIITVKNKDSTKNYKLVNIYCDVIVIYYDELCFFRDNQETTVGLTEAWDYCIAEPMDPNCKELIAKEKEMGNTVSIVYWDDSYCGSPMKGKIPDVKEYDNYLQMVIATNKDLRYFLLQK